MKSNDKKDIKVVAYTRVGNIEQLDYYIKEKENNVEIEY